VKAYLFAALFVVGNVLLPQLCHLVPNGGLMLLPIYFFTLIAAYKYGFWVGLLTAVLSPLVNCVLFGMPPVHALPAILIKSVLLAAIAAYAAHRYGKISIWIILAVVLLYQVIGTAFEWAIVQNFHAALQDFRIGLPGMLLQLVGGYFLLKAIAKY
jgi:hypothetical protein